MTWIEPLGTAMRDAEYSCMALANNIHGTCDLSVQMLANVYPALLTLMKLQSLVVAGSAINMCQCR